MTSVKVLSQPKVKTLSFIALFTVLAVAIPVVAHYFAGSAAGRLFLPIHLFVFVAALLLGWRSGLAVGILTPLISFSFTGMPMAAVLPLVILELALYGILAGYFHKTRGWNVLYSLLGAMFLGRLALWAFIAILPIKMSASAYVLSALQAGLIGIAIQLLLIPLIYKTLKKHISDEKI
jgi:hypothetical protein